MKRLAALLLFFFTLSSYGSEIVAIRTFGHLKVISVTLNAEKSSYTIKADDKFALKTNGETIFKLTAIGDSIEIKSFEKVYGKFKVIRFVGDDENAELKLKLINPDRKPRSYQDDYTITNELGCLKLINEIDLDKYIAGVVESESGTHSVHEFYKVQAILARTFALTHINKHLAEGFSRILFEI